VWIHADVQLDGAIGKQFKDLYSYWRDPDLKLIVIEGVRIYSTVWRCVEQAELRNQRRMLHLALVLQTHTTGMKHVEARCRKRGKTFSEYWTTKEAATEFNMRYLNATARLSRNYPQAIAEINHFWIDDDYTQAPAVEAWLEQRVRLYGRS